MKNLGLAIVTRLVAAVVALGVVSPALARDVETRWYVLMLDGQKAGHLRETRSVTDDRLTTEQEITFTLARAGQDMTITLKSGFVETADAKPVSMHQDQNLGLMKLKTNYTFTPEGVTEVTEQAGIKKEIKHPPITGDWLTPGAIEKLVAGKIKAGEKSFAFRTVSATTGPEAYETKVTVLEANTTAEGMGVVVPATKWETEASVMPGVKNVDWVDANGRPVRTEVEIAGMRLTMLLSDEQVAKSPFKAPEAMAQTTIVPTGEFKLPPRQTINAMYSVSRTDGGSLTFLEKTQDGAQRPTATGPVEVLLKIDANWPVKEDLPLFEPEKYLASTRACNAQDPLIVEMATKAVAPMKDATNTVEKCKTLRRAVFSAIEKKNLGVGMGTASEVVRTRQGDCTEHAVLLAALLRAQGIPSRTVSGLVYADMFEGQRNVFVYHMWTQAWIENGDTRYWLDLDAVLPDDNYFDATHIALSYSDLSDADALNSLVTLTDVIGKLKIHIAVSQ